MGPGGIISGVRVPFGAPAGRKPTMADAKITITYCNS